MPHFGRFEFGNEKPSETYKGDYMVLEKGYVKILRGKPADDETLGVDHDPLLIDLGGLCRKRFHMRKSVNGGYRTHACPNCGDF